MEDELFPKDDDFISYKWESNKGIKIFETPESFVITPADIQMLTINSSDKKTGDQVKIQAAFFGNYTRLNQDSLLIFCHGADYHMDYWYEQIKVLSQCRSSNQPNILMFDYQGLGRSGGQTSVAALYQDALAIKNWLIANEVQQDKIIVYGQGMGAVAACELVTTQEEFYTPPSTLILENPVGEASSLYTESNQINLPTSFLDQPSFNNIKLIKQFKGKLLIFLSEKDEKYQNSINGSEIFKAHTGTHKILQVVNATHRDLIPSLGFEEYCHIISEFYRSN